MPSAAEAVVLVAGGHRGGGGWTTPPGSRPLHYGYLDAQGREILPKGALDDCRTDFDTCARDAGLTGTFAYYHPASRFWPFQIVEAVILLALAGAALGAGAWALRHRVHRP